MLSEPQLSVTHVDTQCTKWIACCDLGDSQSTSELSLVHCIQCHHSHGWANDMFHIYNPKKMLPQGCGELKYLPSQWQKDIYPPHPTEMITCKITLFDSNWWFPLYLTGKVTGDNFLHDSNPILFLRITLIWISYLYQLKRNFHLSDCCEGESIINGMPQMVNLWKGSLKREWQPLLSMCSCRVSSGTPFTFFLLYVLCLYYYCSSIKHLISLLPETPPRDIYWSGLWKIFQMTQLHLSDFSWLN